MYRLAFTSSDGGDSFPDTSRDSVQGVHRVRLKSGENLVIVRQELKLLGYKFIETKWSKVWEEKVYNKSGQYPLTKYPWAINDKIRPDESMIVLKHPDGVQVYSIDMAKPGLNKLADDGLYFGDSRKLLWGNFLPNHPNWLSVMARDKRNKIDFRIFNETSFDYGNFEDGNDPSFSLYDVKLTPIWSTSNADFFTADLRNKGIDGIGVRDTDNNMEFYEFDKNVNLQRVFKTSAIPRSTSDSLFFMNLSKQEYKDMLHLNDTGLFTYQYDNNDYKFVNFNGDFSHSSGWKSDYTNTMKIIDIDNDNRDDLVFTGQNGIRGLKFDTSSNKWIEILNSSELKSLQKYANIVGVYPPSTLIKNPSIFVQDDEGKVHWSEITEKNPSPKLTTSTTEAPDTTTENPEDAILPRQKTRSALPKKPVLKWSEQWEEHFIKDAVDMGSGQVQFQLPLIDITSATGWGLKMPLAYNSQSTNTNHFGVGWAMALGHEFIYVDYKGSIFDRDAQYNLMVQGRPKLLKLIETKNGVDYFKLADAKRDEKDDVSIEYHRDEELWVIDGDAEKVVYGTSTGEDVTTDALQWSLRWKYWRGAGRDKSNLEKYVTAWFISNRVKKANKKSLHYSYDNDFKFIGQYFYTSAKRLKSIRDNDHFTLNFEYAAKSSNEFDIAKSVDDDGNIFFPVPLDNSHYVNGYDIMTSKYQQKFEFIYEVRNDKRLLTGIGQNDELIFKFGYSEMLKHTLLTSCKVPRGSTMNFDYEKIAVPNPIDIVRYNANKSMGLAYGMDYGVIVQANDGKINVKITNREMTLTTVDCESDSDLQCPIADKSVKDILFVLTYENSFVIFASDNDEGSMVFFYQRKDKKWSLNKERQINCGKLALFGISEKVIAVSEKNSRKLSIFWHGDEWKTQNIDLETPLTRLALHDQLIAAYDDSNLMLYHKDSSDIWQLRVINSNMHDMRVNYDMFDFDDETRTRLINYPNQEGLKIMNNLIALSSVKESNGFLVCIIVLFILNDKYEIVKSYTYRKNRQNIHEMEYVLEDKDKDTEKVKNAFYMKYVRDGNVYKWRVYKITGEKAKKIENIGNNNIRKDAMDKFLKKANDDEGIQKNSKKAHKIDQSYYSMQATQQGVVNGNDTMIRMTGNDFVVEELKNDQKIKLGKNFVLEPIDKERKSYRLYKDNNPVKRFNLHKPGKLLNRYPFYIAYHTSEDSIEVTTFKDENTLGDILTFNNEHLGVESDYKNLVTKFNGTESQQLLIRPSSTLVNHDTLFVSKSTHTHEDFIRPTGYRRTYERDNDKKKFIETVIMIPGDDQNSHGTYEAINTLHLKSGNTTTSERYFDASGDEIIAPARLEDDKKEEEDEKSAKLHRIYDKSDKWLISDFSPYEVKDEIGSYYGFEDYEKNSIGSTKSWKITKANIVRGSFSFVGDNFLQLKTLSELRGEFEPVHQDIPYLAACWIRTSEPLKLDSAVPYLTAVLSTKNANEFIGLQSQVKRQNGDWYYLELPINFDIINQVYREYAKHNNLPIDDDSKFKIALVMEAHDQDVIDVDHIRFAPFMIDFHATIFDPITGSQRAYIQSNGLVLRTFYNHLKQPLADIHDDGNIESLTTSNRLGKLNVEGSKIKSQTNVVTFEPEEGFHETFDAFAFKTRWMIKKPDGWKAANGQLWYNSAEERQIVMRNGHLDNTAVAIRMFISLANSNSHLSLKFKNFGDFSFTRDSDDENVKLTLPNNEVITNLPISAEVIVMIDHESTWVWLDGVLIVDEIFTHTSQISSFAMEMQGEVTIEDLFVMNRPHVRVEYQNAFGERTQVIQLESSESALVTETLYDELGRDGINTKTTRVGRSSEGAPLLAYRENFVVNKKTVWRDGNIKGEINDLNKNDQGYPYTRTKFASHPLNEKVVLGMPGKDFAVNSRYAIKMSSKSDIAFMHNLFPSKKSYVQKEQKTPNGSRKVSIYDKYENEVAIYERAAGTNHLLSTYEYDKKNRLVKILPPIYHEKLKTEMRLTPWEFGDDHLTKEEKFWQDKLATRMIYNEKGQMVKKITPESGTVEYIYNKAGNKRFVVSTDGAEVKSVIFFDHDVEGTIIRSGHFDGEHTMDELKKHAEEMSLPTTAKTYQESRFTDDHYEPKARSRVKYLATHNEDYPVVENLHFDGNQQMVAKRTMAPDDTEEKSEIQKNFVRDRVRTIKYPVNVNGKPLELIHTYNRLGKLVKLTTGNDELVKFEYTPGGYLASEKYTNGLNRKYRYNSPGFLERISDNFITENILYTQKGYGQDGFGDGMVMQATFSANWIENADRRPFQLKASDLDEKYGQECMNGLKRTGHLNANGQPMKLLTRDAEISLPLVCNESELAKKIAEKMPPNFHGYRFTYGNHQELINAKYLTEDTEESIEPLKIDTFSKEIDGLTADDSREIWQALNDEGFIIVDKSGSEFSIGKKDKSIFQDEILNEDLKNLTKDYTVYGENIKRLILHAISMRNSLNADHFKEVYLQWNGVDGNTAKPIQNQKMKEAKEIFAMLEDKNYLPNYSNINALHLDENFLKVFNKYSQFIPEIVKVLTHKFAYALGQSPFDVESYKIDSNGNHHHFYTGFDRYKLNYPEGSNQVESIEMGSDTIDGEAKAHPVKHDVQGNVIHASHKGIENIEYHPVSQRVTKMTLMDGRVLKFNYDAKGERILKQVYNGENEKTHETRYLRDEKGRVMVEQKTTYLKDDNALRVDTAYIYGPKGMLGFIRNDKFYSVTLDHSGSVRLVSKDNEVVAAYDYLPYGQLMRSYGNDPKAHIDYRYTGQEYDDETGLYNYHARLYDPTIGRFYQLDPKSQYFSPYKYAGNSPVSVIDPDGEFAVLLFFGIVGAAIGTFLGGAAMNNRLNPAEWDWGDSGTWLGIIGGGIGGALLPVGFVLSIDAIGIAGTIGLGALFAYGSAAAAGGWDPSKWNWDEPGTWNSLFTGFAMGSGLAGGINGIKTFYKEGKALISLGNIIGQNLAKGLFVTSTVLSGVGIAYGMGVLNNNNNPSFWEWDWTDPSTYYTLIDGFNTGMTLPRNLMQVTRGIKKIVTNPKRLGAMLGENASRRAAIIAILKNTNHPLYKTTFSIILGYTMGAVAAGDFNPANWDGKLSTIMGVVNGAFLGKGFLTMFKSPIKFGTSYDLETGKLTKTSLFSKDFAIAMKVYKGIRENFQIKSTIESMFTSSSRRSFVLGTIEDASLRAKFENFLKNNFESWRKGNVALPNEINIELKSFVEREFDGPNSVFTRISAENDALASAQQRIFPDRQVSYLSCSSTGSGCQVSIPPNEGQSKGTPIRSFSMYELKTVDTKTRSKRSYDDEKVIHAANNRWSKFTNMFSSRQQLPFESNNSSQSIAVDEYTTGHFNGILQLLDLFIRKHTGQKYSNHTESFNSELDFAERCLKASENAAKYIEEYGDDEMTDEYECYEALMRGEQVNTEFVPQLNYSNVNMQENNYARLN